MAELYFFPQTIDEALALIYLRSTSFSGTPEEFSDKYDECLELIQTHRIAKRQEKNPASKQTIRY